MTDGDKREAAQAVGVIMVLALLPALFVAIIGPERWSPYAVWIWLLWCVGGVLGILVSRAMIPVFNGCSCEKCQADVNAIILSFVLWPLAIPGVAGAALAAWLVRVALS